MEKTWCSDCKYLKDGNCTLPNVVVHLKHGQVVSCDSKSTGHVIKEKLPENTVEFFMKVKSLIDKKLNDEIEKWSDTSAREKAKHILEGGKRLRPSLTILSYLASGGSYEGLEKALESAVSLEIQHCSSLALDDLMDKDLERRGKPSFPFLYPESAILFPLQLIYTAFRQISRHGPEILNTVFKTGEVIIRGQEKDLKTFDIDKIKSIPTLGSEYFEIISEKTAKAFATASKVGCMEAGGKDDLQKLFELYGMEIGLAYQLADDLVDLVKGKFPLSKMLMCWGAQLEESLRSNFSEALKGNVSPIFLTTIKLSVKSFLENEMRKRIENAIECVKKMDIPESPYKKILYEAPEYITKQQLSEAGLEAS
ncbi:MAG: polyprenyl synthetase family protein [Nitrososphaerales archaeon]